MAANSKTSSRKDPAKAVEKVATKVAEAKSARAGDIVFRLTGERSGTYRLATRHGSAEVSDSVDADSRPLFEVTGDADTIQDILEGNADAREEFLAGGIRVRGDLQHLSDLAMELGILDQPL